MGSSSIGTRLAHVKSVCACQWRGLTHSPGESRGVERRAGRAGVAQAGAAARARSRRTAFLAAQVRDDSYPYPTGPHTETMQHSATLVALLVIAFSSPKSEIGTVRIRRRGSLRSVSAHAVRSASLRPRHADPACGGAFDTSGKASRTPAHALPPRAPLIPPGICGHVSPVPESTPTRHITRPRVFVSCT